MRRLDIGWFGAVLGVAVGLVLTVAAVWLLLTLVYVTDDFVRWLW